MRNNKLRNGFSLVELAIIMVVIGLLSVAVIGGQGLINSGKMGKLASEMQTIRQAVNGFRSVYSALPGDLKNATSYFGSSNLADGDGDGIIAQGDNDTADEVNNAMVHLSRSGLIEATDLANNGTKFVALKSYPGELYLSSNKDDEGADVSGFSYVSGTHNFIIAAASGYGYNAVAKPLVAYNVDKKLDDGFPRTGNVTYIVSGNVSDASCTNSTTEYYLTSNALACNISFQID